ncbi:MAG: DUF4369 domain-containing protein [Bacteroidaceae bacterium]|nr:DUF4369 domain-containing protein [Bacteroidaceae bacterium]
MKRILFFVSIVLLVCSCAKEKNGFTVQGKIENAAGDTLYIESLSLLGVGKLDSVTIKKDGSYSFELPATQYPEFYRLRLGQSAINFVIDSTETIGISSDKANFSTAYTIEGSAQNEKIKDIALEGKSLKQKLDEYEQQLNAKAIDKAAYDSAVITAVNDYKKVVSPIIFEDLKSPVAYFGLFQRVNSLLVYDPYEKSDNRFYGAVANAYNIHYPESDRTKQLSALALESMKSLRQKGIDSDKLKEVSYIDIKLEDRNGKEIALSSIVGKKKAILIDFIAFDAAYAPNYTALLLNLYKKYADKGLEIYQVSLDEDENLWKVTSEKLPWISVRDPKTIHSVYALQYNVEILPSFFLMDEKGNIVKRNSEMEGLENEIKKLLK